MHVQYSYRELESASAKNKMYQKLFAILTVMFVQTANGQTARCRTAYLYGLDSSCVSRLYNGDATVCPTSDVCGHQLYSTLSACASSVSLILSCIYMLVT